MMRNSVSVVKPEVLCEVDVAIVAEGDRDIALHTPSVAVVG